MPWGDCAPNNVATLNCIPAVFQNIVRGAFIFVSITALLLFIFSGFKYINSNGDPKQVDGARNTLMFAILGFIIVLLAFAIVNIIGYVSGVPCITTFGFTSCK